jgi:hypothetical protein
MGWFKRNLFFAVGGLVAIGLLGAAGFYDYKSYQRNNAAFGQLDELYKKLKNNTVKDNRNGKQVSPGNSTVDNVAAARDQERQLRQWINQATNYFQPIAPIPRPAKGPLSSPLFSGALHETIAQLQHNAAAANVALPPQYDFSFTAHMDRLTYAPGSLEPLSVQLGEVKAIAEVLFAAGINALDGVQRLRVSPDDAGGPATDYLDDQPVTTDLGVLTPYQVTFRGFSPEIARVLAGFAAAPNGFIVKGISVQPAAPTGANPADTGGNPPFGGDAARAAAMAAYARATGVGAAPAAAQPGQSGLQSVLNEQLLSVTLKVEVVKLTPRN